MTTLAPVGDPRHHADKWGQALCLTMPIADWDWMSDARPDQAILLCQRCPVRTTCAAEADRLETHSSDVHLVWGGETPSQRKRRRGSRKCAVTWCQISALSGGYCKKHYQTWANAGRPDGWQPRNPDGRGACAADGCDQKHRVRGWCNLHYDQWRRDGRPADFTPRPLSKKRTK